MPLLLFSKFYGSAVSIFNEWKDDLAKPTAEALMDFVQVLKDLGLTAKECARGAELLGILRRHGAKEEKVESFLTQLIALLVAAHVPPDTIAQQVQRMLKLAEEAETPVDQVLDKVESAREEEKRVAAQI
jgi:hypothetical protein